jgi:hypothetical protein
VPIATLNLLEGTLPQVKLLGDLLERQTLFRTGTGQALGMNPPRGGAGLLRDVVHRAPLTRMGSAFGFGLGIGFGSGFSDGNGYGFGGGLPGRLNHCIFRR